MRIRSHPRLTPLLLALGSLVLLTGCSEWGDPPGPQAGGTMRVSVSSLPATWNPDSATDTTSAQLVRDVEAPLLQLTPHTQQAAAGIARSWKYNKSRTRLTVGIRPKAAFSNGEHVTPKDVVFSVDQWLKGPQRGPFYSSLISSVAAHGKDSVVFTLDTPSSALIDALTLSSSAIIPNDFGGDTATDFYTHPVGAGPFAIASTSSDTIHLKRNKHFYEKGHPYLSAIDYRVVSDPATALQRVSGGKTDLAESVPASALSSGHKHARVVTTPSQSTSVLTFSSKASPAIDPKLRKAVSLAIDRSTLVKSAYDGKADVAKGLLPGNVKADQGCPSCHWSQHDVSLAKSDAASSRHRGVLTLLVDSGQPSDVSTAQAITPMLAQAGITVRTVPVNATTMAARLASGSYEMALRTLSVQTPTPAESLATLAHDHYATDAASTQAVASALQGVNAATDEQGTSTAVAEFEEQNFASAAMVPLVDPDVVYVVSTRVRGLTVLSSGLYHSAALWLKD